MTESLIHIASLLILWMGVWGIAFYVLMPRGIDYLRRWWIFALHFLAATALGALLFRSEIETMFNTNGVPLLPFILLGMTMASIVSIFRYTKTHVQRPTQAEFSSGGSSPYFLTLDDRYIASKSCEILFQQLVIVVLVILLLRFGLTLWQTMLVFAILFGGIHLPLLLTGNIFWGWYFTLFAIGSSLIFPPLISKTPYGFVYTYIIHWVFYTVSGVFYGYGMGTMKNKKQIG